MKKTTTPFITALTALALLSTACDPGECTAGAAAGNENASETGDLEPPEEGPDDESSPEEMEGGGGSEPSDGEPDPGDDPDEEDCEPSLDFDPEPFTEVESWIEGTVEYRTATASWLRTDGEQANVSVWFRSDVGVTDVAVYMGEAGSGAGVSSPELFAAVYVEDGPLGPRTETVYGPQSVEGLENMHEMIPPPGVSGAIWDAIINGGDDIPVIKCSEFGKKVTKFAKYAWYGIVGAGVAACCVGSSGIACIICSGAGGAGGAAGGDKIDQHCDKEKD